MRFQVCCYSLNSWEFRADAIVYLKVRFGHPNTHVLANDKARHSYFAWRCLLADVGNSERMYGLADTKIYAYPPHRGVVHSYFPAF